VCLCVCVRVCASADVMPGVQTFETVCDYKFAGPVILINAKVRRRLFYTFLLDCGCLTTFIFQTFFFLLDIYVVNLLHAADHTDDDVILKL